MKFQQIMNPRPYDKGTENMWTDAYISRQLLEMHLNTDNDIASRKKDNIEETVQWILKEFGKEKGTLLDLGCGPGLYAESFAKAGLNVTGIDFSLNSISYAKEHAMQNGLDICYICRNYLDLDYENQFDLIIMIYCDFGVLSIEERNILLKNILRALKKDGIFIFDALNKHTLEKLKFEKNWEYCEQGFWMDKPHICLSQTFHFPEMKAVLDQHIVITEEEKYKLYRFWNHYFDGDEIENLFLKAGFRSVKSYQNMISGNTMYNDSGVTFYKAQK